jgi:hypothetical protein
MLQKIFFCVLLPVLSFPLNAQQWKWAHTITDAKSNSDVRGVKIDGRGNTYIAGEVNESVNVCSESFGSENFLIKYDTSGNCVWIKHFKAKINALDIRNDRLLITGSFQADFSIGSTNFICKGTSELYAAELDPDGNLLWSYTSGMQGVNAGGNACHYDSQGNLYLGGTYKDTLQLGNVILPGQVRNIYLMKINTLRQIQWIRNAVGLRNDWESGEVYIKSIKTDALQNVFIAGSFYGPVAFGQDTLDISVYSSVYFLKYDPDGNRIKIHTRGSKTSFYGMEVAPDGSVYANICDCNQYFSDAHIRKYDKDFNTLWTLNTRNYYLTPFFLEGGVGMDSLGNIYVSGSFVDSTQFNNLYLRSKEVDILVAKLEPDGHIAWLTTTSGRSLNYTGKLAAGKDGKVVITGEMLDQTAFGSIVINTQDTKNFRRFAAFITPPAKETEILVTAINDTVLCNGGTFSVKYSSNRVFNPDNRFDVFLSDSLGSLKRAVKIGELTGSSSTGDISCRLPHNIKNGDKYKVLVCSYSPVTYSRYRIPPFRISNPNAGINFMGYFCYNSDTVRLSYGYPSGGAHYGIGVINDVLYTKKAGLGVHELVYFYQDPDGCKDTAFQKFRIIDCVAGIEDPDMPGTGIYPNPSNGIVYLEPGETIGYACLRNLLGEVLCQWSFSGREKRLELHTGSRPPGLYVLEVRAQGKTHMHKILLK